MQSKVKVLVIGLLIGLALSGFIGIVQTRLNAMSANDSMVNVSAQYQFLGDDSPRIEALEGNPNWSTDRVFKMFSSGQWQLFSNGQFVFQPGPTASVRRDLFPIRGTYTTGDGEILFQAERRSESTSAVASVDGMLMLNGEQATVEIIYTVVALDSQRVVHVSQALLPVSNDELIENVPFSSPTNEPLFEGTWQLPDLETLELQQRGQQVEGTYTGRGGGQISGQVEGSWLSFTWQDPQEMGRGFLRAVSQGRTLAGLLETRAGELSNLLATRTSAPEINEDELASLSREGLRDQGYSYVLDSQCDRAIPYLDRALSLYRADRDNPEIWEVMRDSALIDEINISTRLIHCHFQLKNYEPLLDALIDTVEIRRILSDRPYLSNLAQENLDNLASRLENWRSRLAEDTARISAVDQGQRFFDTLVRVFVELSDRNSDSYEAALVASEQSRARAFADLLYRKLSADQASEFVTAQSLSTSDIKEIAREQSATLVEYFYAEDVQQLYTWVVQPTGDIHFQATTVQDNLDELVQLTRSSFERRRGGFELVSGAEVTAELDLLPELHRLLIEPITTLLPSDPMDRIIFIPQGQLFLVPFPALRSKDGAYLIEQHTVQTAPSIQAIDLIHQRYEGGIQQRNWQSEDFLIVGDPEMPEVRLRTDSEPIQLPSLAGAKNEAEAIGKLFEAPFLTGNVASELRVTEQMEVARVIHLATHGLLEYAESEQIPGALAFAPTEGLDGLLTSSDILELELKADLVVLSACDTGRGQITGDGVVGLSRSLLQAGAASVVVSLWAVPDAATAALMIDFYQRLKQGEEKTQALRQAMLSTMDDYPEPDNWAAFTLIGEAQ